DNPGPPEEVGPRRLEPVLVRSRERMASGKPIANAESLRARDNGALHRSDVGDEGVRLEMRSERIELREIGGGGSGEKEEIGDACDIGGVGRERKSTGLE